MDDVRTLAACRRRRALARADLFAIIGRRTMTAATAGFRELGRSSTAAAEQITDVATTLEVQRMWEVACDGHDSAR